MIKVPQQGRVGSAFSQTNTAVVLRATLRRLCERWDRVCMSLFERGNVILNFERNGLSADR